MRVLIVGAGIGGLALALCLRQRGVLADVFERAPALVEVGSAIMTSVNAVRVLARLGLAEGIAAKAVPARVAELRSWRGPKLLELPLDGYNKASGGGQTFVLHRADLQATLVRATDPARLHLGRAFSGFHEHAHGVTAHFSDGSEERGDVLVGADGIRSAVRAELHGVIAPRPSGTVCWRGIAHGFRHPTLPPGRISERQGPGARFGVAHIDADRIGWYATLFGPPGGTDLLPGGFRQSLDPGFAGWDDLVTGLIEATDPREVVRSDLCDLPCLPWWGRGRVTLLGDAAHAMLPNLGQGGGAALEDAWTLARCLARPDDLGHALRAYEARRRRRTSRLQRLSRLYGRFFQWRSPFWCRLREWAVWLSPRLCHDLGFQMVFGWRPHP